MTVIPNFDDVETDRKFVIICSKGNLDMAYPALVLANAALGEGIETHLFFTFWGFDMIIESRMDDLQFSPAGNTAMHFPVKGKEIRIPQAVMPLPGMTGHGDQDAQGAARRHGHPAGARLPGPDRRLRRPPVGLSMSADMNKVEMDDLYEGVEDIINATDFIEMTEGAQLLFI